MICILNSSIFLARFAICRLVPYWVILIRETTPFVSGPAKKITQDDMTTGSTYSISLPILLQAPHMRLNQFPSIWSTSIALPPQPVFLQELIRDLFPLFPIKINPSRLPFQFPKDIIRMRSGLPI